ncbi:hypothetical protein SDC9_189507 [bioreactor metagenome]|uniref:Uncharacterized protein n=1 Tax=bioreactor metagenome TaxID=1076179 RepID=A0A645HU00_9ZZZZ
MKPGILRNLSTPGSDAGNRKIKLPVQKLKIKLKISFLF